MSTLVESKRLTYTRHAYALIREAQRCLAGCGAVHAAARVKATFKSVEGAIRHAQRLDYLGDEDLAAMRKIRCHRRKPKSRNSMRQSRRSNQE